MDVTSFDGRWLIVALVDHTDASHLTPSFAGLGVNSGIRDAANLA